MTFAAEIGRMLVNGPMRQLSEDESMNFITIAFLAEETVEDQIAGYKSMMQQSMALTILHQRLELHMGKEIKFSPTLLMWLSSLVDRAGYAILMLSVVKLMQEEGLDLTVRELVEKYFLVGVPTQQSLKAAWEAQKVNRERIEKLGAKELSSDNCLDYEEAWV